MSQKQRIASIDILRVIAVFLVIGRHSYVLLQYYEYGPWVRMATAIWQQVGWMGVDLFFVLSGYLVSGLLFRNPDKLEGLKFFIRRGFKIYPAFYILIATTFVYYLVAQCTIEPSLFYSEVLFLQSYAHHFWPHTWSLAVEEHFYILLPIFLWVLKRTQSNSDRPFNALPVAVLAVCIAALAGRVVLFLSGDMSYLRSEWFDTTHLRIDSLAFGVLLAYWTNFAPDKLKFVQAHKREALLLAIVLIAPVAFLDLDESGFLNTIGYTFLYVAFGMIVLVSINSARLLKFANTRAGRLMTFLGERSYSIYLWHFPTKLMVRSLFVNLLGQPAPTFTEIAVYMIGSVILGLITAQLIELPALKLRERLFGRKESSALAVLPDMKISLQA